MNKKLSVILDLPKSVIPKIRSIQNELAKKIDNVVTREEKFHLTVKVADNVDDSKLLEITKKVKDIFQDIKLKVKLGPLSDLVNHKDQGVIYISAKSEQLLSLHNKIKSILEQYGGTFLYDEFKGHITLFYLDKPVSDQQKQIMNNLKFNDEVILTSQELQISIKENDDWKRIAKLSKRFLFWG